MKVVSKMKYMIYLVVALMTFSAAFTIYKVNDMRGDAKVVNVSGIVRGATQRLMKLELAGKPSDKLITTIEGHMTSLTDGNSEAGIPKAKDKDYIEKMEILKKKFAVLKQEIMNVRQGANGQKLIDLSEDFFESSNKAVKAAEIFSEKKVATLKTMQYIFSAINILMLLALSQIMSKVTAPVELLEKYLLKMADYNLKPDDEKTQYDKYIKQKNEFTQCLDASVKMRVNFISLISSITDQSKQLIDMGQEMTATTQETSAAANQTLKAITNIAKSAALQASETQSALENIDSAHKLLENMGDLAKDLESSMENINVIKDEGKVSLEEMIDTANRNNATVEKMSDVILDANQSVGKISKASEMIQALSDQTNLLALNAAIDIAVVM